MHTHRLRRPMLAALLAIGGISACSETTGPINGEISLRNSLADSVSVSAWDLEVSNTIDLPASPPPRAGLGSTILAPGQTRQLRLSEIAGYQRRSGLRVFTWRVRGDVVQFGPIFTWTYEQLQRSDFSIDLAIAVPFE